MNNTVIAELLNGTRLREAPVMAATLVRTIIDGMNRPPRFSDALTCPKCGSSDTRRSRARSVWEASRRQLTVTAPYRCGKCGYRGWGPDAHIPPRVAPAADPTTSMPAPFYASGLSAAARWEQLDFHALNIPPR